MTRATREQVEARVNDLLRIMLDGAEPGWDICEFVREQEQTEGSNWHVADGEKPLSYSQIRRYVEKAEQRIFKSIRTSPKRQLRLHLAKRRALYAKALSQGDIRAALACLDSEAKLLNLFDVDIVRQLEEMRRQIAELKANGIGNPTPPAQGNASRTNGVSRLPGIAGPGEDSP
jgi:hypothetical protein